MFHNSTTESLPWVEKYRPTHFDHIVLDQINRTIFENIVSSRYFPNLLLYGPPGTGKTTAVQTLVKDFTAINNPLNRSQKESIIHLNASDERGIDVIRNQILNFVKAKNLFIQGMKFVILDEVDCMTKDAQQAFKYLLQTTNTNTVRFCLICNYISKINESLRNEFIVIRFNQLPPEDICTFLKEIVTKENVEVDDNEIVLIQKKYRSDIRSMINFIQQSSSSSKEEDHFISILSDQVFDTFHTFLQSKISLQEKTTELHEMSVKYNMDKKCLLKQYFNHLIRFNYIPQEKAKLFLSLLNDIIHNGNANSDLCLQYYVVNFF